MAWFPDSVHGRLSNRLAANTDERTEGGGIPSAAADKPWVPTAVGERCLHGGAAVPERPFMPSCQGRPDTAGPSVPGLPAGPYENAAAFGRPVRSRGGMALRSEERRERRYRRRRMSREARRRDAIWRRAAWTPPCRCARWWMPRIIVSEGLPGSAMCRDSA